MVALSKEAGIKIDRKKLYERAINLKVKNGVILLNPDNDFHKEIFEDEDD